MKFVSEVSRTHYCGNLNLTHAGKDVVLMGWVDTRRDHGGLVFVDLRDREGIVQVVLNPASTGTASSKDFRGEFVVAIRGKVNKRPDGMTNKKMKTGEIEVVAETCEILSKAETPPFGITDTDVNENLRLQYRYLDLRSPRLQNFMRVRHDVMQTVREFLAKEGFWEIETPILYKSTPEGARDYLVPSRVHPGSFYALPQSPQTLKQLLMVSGMDKYFQIARCFRDEDLRADRQPEFSQIDCEMSFINQEDVMQVNERLVRHVWKKVKGIEIEKIHRMTFDEAMDRFGNDKPDIRFGLELKNLADKVKGSGFKVFDDTIANGHAVKGFACPEGGEFSRGQLDKLTEIAKKAGAKGLVWIKSEAGGKVSSPISKFFSEEKLMDLVVACGGKKGDCALIVADEYEVTSKALSTLRLHLGEELKLIDKSKDVFLWVYDFPLFEYDPEAKRWMARHHPFTMAKYEHIDIMLAGDTKRYGEVKAQAYDLVCNGYEVLGGSIRIYRQDVQAAMFAALGLSEEEVKHRFGFFINALKFGTPPHGGFAWGLDRLVMILCQTDAIREVIAFPKTLKASDMMSEAPTTVDRAQLLELGIRLAQKDKE
ncbi:MAG: aspartate--tRNA ligase [Proteobacteria bacterium SG_bin7]|nr:MAG: aspartate--tRNA ligase [Proteobacteria bacterium SG_bin7]